MKQDGRKNIAFSTKITVVQFILSILVVYQHTQYRYSGEVFGKIQRFLFYLIQAAVPMFFMISGYLFYRTFKPENTKEKLLSRVRTLVIPYLVWNVIYTVFTVVLYKLNFIKNTYIEFNWKILVQTINSDFSPLWFLKYLIVFSLIAPVMYYLLKNKYIGAGVVVLTVTLNVVFIACGVIKAPLDVNSNSFAMFNYQYVYYVVGAYSALHLKNVIEQPHRNKTTIGICGVSVLCLLYWMPFFENSVLIGHTFRLFFVVFLWFAFDLLRDIEIKPFLKTSFFIYCSHLMIVQCMQGVIGIALRNSFEVGSIIYLIEWLVVPIFTVFIVLCGAQILKKYTPVVWKILTGR